MGNLPQPPNVVILLLALLHQKGLGIDQRTYEAQSVSSLALYRKKPADF